MRSRIFLILGLAITITLLIAACQPQEFVTVEVPVDREVIVTQEVEVEVEREVIITLTPEPLPEADTIRIGGIGPL
ncbi:MAG: hypothetical protein ACNA8H_01300, partial [Anaerolineales bacterium]